ncbi:MAG TPA: DNA polymerase I [Pseudobdellovibrionaceae bacterium]|nr:DNA polymerase I [Pseudobdellovibrionaceae bacterium]
MKTVYLVDVSSMFFRAYYAIRPLTSPSGVPVNAVYGFLSMLTKLLKEEKPSYLVFCYDRKEPSFRKDLYEDYKANRSEMPEDLAQQIPYIKKLATLLGIPTLEVPGFEADDLIGTLACKARAHGAQAVIVSGDKDFGQLLEPGIVLYDTMKNIRYDANGAKEKWGVRPDQMIDYLALVGDSSDNIPGVAGIGPKGAIKLLEQFPSLEAIYENLDAVESKSVREKLSKSKDMAFLSKKLVTISTDVEVPDDFEHYRIKSYDRAELLALLQELNFKSFEKTLLGEGDSVAGTGTPVDPASSVPTTSAPVAPPPKGDYEVEILSEKDLISKLRPGGTYWGFQDERGLFVAGNTKIYSLDGEPRELGTAADRLMVLWKGFDLKAFWHKIGAEHPMAAWDSMLAAYVVEAGDCSDFHKMLTKHVGNPLPEFPSPEQVLSAQIHLEAVLAQRLKERAGERVYLELELPLAAILLRMEKKGIRIDLARLREQSEELASEISAAEKEVHALAGESFNIGSPKQLGHILFEKLGLPVVKKTKTGYSTDSDVLEKTNHPIAEKVLLWRELSKLKSTYVDALPQLAKEGDRVHTSFNQALTATGRLSSTAPNLQNIPVRTERGQRVRKAFVAAPGKKLLSVDYSQIELRILAHISGDPGLTKAFAEDLDIHSATAVEVFGLALKDVTPEHRRVAKAVNFGIAYGQAAFGLAETLGIPRGEAQGIIKRYFEKFKGVEDYIQETVKTAHEKGYVETLFGRRRYIDELKSKNGTLRKFGERAAINAPIQGTASDLVKKAMIELGRAVNTDMLLQVHDELIFEGTEDELNAAAPKILGVMEGIATLKVPLKANYAIGDNWDEAH